MVDYNWHGLMDTWSKEIVASRSFAAFLESAANEHPGSYTEDVLQSGWLGYPAASDEQIARAEARLGRTLPPDYRSFLQFSNGWRYLEQFIPRLWNSEEVEWTSIADPGLIAAWNEGVLLYSPEPTHESQYLGSTLRISDLEYGGTAVLLLNPEVVTPEGEWEAWFFAHWLPGARIYRSFWELMQGLHQEFLLLEKYQSK